MSVTMSVTTTSSSTTTTTLPGLPISLRIALIKPGRLVKFMARGSFALPDPNTDNPTAEGGSFTVTGTTGSVAYPLDAAGWKGLGPSGDGSRGFKFRGTPCRMVLVREQVVKAVCRDDTGTLAVPEAGPVDFVLTVGMTRYCGQCGGSVWGNPAMLFKRRECVVPVACP